MTSALDMSLDDLIKSNKKSGGGGTGGNPRSRGRGSSGPGPGPIRRLPNRAGAQPGPYSVGKAPAPDSAWQHDLYSEMAALAPAGRAASIETGTKLYISNLDYGVSNEDIKELFSEVGDLKRFSIHYDRSGRSKGTAEVVFSRRGDALSAVKRYNNVQLDGKPMKIEIVGTNIATPGVVPQAQVSNGVFVNPSGIPRSASGRGGFGGLPRGGGRGRGRGRGRSRGQSEPVSVADLDADLEKYHSKAMQIN